MGPRASSTLLETGLGAEPQCLAGRGRDLGAWLGLVSRQHTTGDLEEPVVAGGGLLIADAVAAMPMGARGFSALPGELRGLRAAASSRDGRGQAAERVSSQASRVKLWARLASANWMLPKTPCASSILLDRRRGG